MSGVIGKMNIAPLQQHHFEAVKEIYALGIITGMATFQEDVPTWESWDEGHLKKGRLVALDGDEVLGWAALTPVSGRCVYAGVAEVSIYIHPDHRGLGIGRALLKVLIAESEKQNLWTLQAGIFPENAASLKIHTQCGFRQVGYREKIGQLKGVWRDTILLERRSQTIGI